MKQKEWTNNKRNFERYKKIDKLANQITNITSNVIVKRQRKNENQKPKKKTK
jgi:hypothetical protein